MAKAVATIRPDEVFVVVRLTLRDEYRYLTDKHQWTTMLPCAHFMRGEKGYAEAVKAQAKMVERGFTFVNVRSVSMSLTNRRRWP
jgi:hypothetical protein